MDALGKLLGGFEVSIMLKEIEISEDFDACYDESMPVESLEFSVNGFYMISKTPVKITRVQVFSSDFS